MREVRFSTYWVGHINDDVLPRAVAMDDFDGDGDDELAVGTASGTLHLYKPSGQDALGELHRWRVGRDGSPITCVLTGNLIGGDTPCCVAIAVDGHTLAVVHAAPEPGRSRWRTAAAEQMLASNVQHAVIAEMEGTAQPALVVGTSDGRIEAYTFSGADGGADERSQLQRGIDAVMGKKSPRQWRMTHSLQLSEGVTGLAVAGPGKDGRQRFAVTVTGAAEERLVSLDLVRRDGDRSVDVSEHGGAWARGEAAEERHGRWVAQQLSLARGGGESPRDSSSQAPKPAVALASCLWSSAVKESPVAGTPVRSGSQSPIGKPESQKGARLGKRVVASVGAQGRLRFNEANASGGCETVAALTPPWRGRCLGVAFRPTTSQTPGGPMGLQAVTCSEEGCVVISDAAMQAVTLDLEEPASAFAVGKVSLIPRGGDADTVLPGATGKGSTPHGASAAAGEEQFALAVVLLSGQIRVYRDMGLASLQASTLMQSCVHGDLARLFPPNVDSDGIRATVEAAIYSDWSGGLRGAIQEAIYSDWSGESLQVHVEELRRRKTRRGSSEISRRGSSGGASVRGDDDAHSITPQPDSPHA